MKSGIKQLEGISIRRASIADMDKVRYRVYSTPTEFIAVIAESALMAVKVSGVSKPHKIVRDLPTEGIAIEAKKMAEMDKAAPRFDLPTVPAVHTKKLIAELAADAPAKETLFKPMHLGDLQRNDTSRVRILPPELVSEIIEEHSKAQAQQNEQAQQSQPIPAETANEAVMPALSPKEKLMEMAQNLPTRRETQGGGETELSPEEVEKLLNG